ncbi:MAG TPA: methyltransferase domain-containing protein [Polyangia bacterium]
MGPGRGAAPASYETLFRRGERLFGPPLPRVVRFFADRVAAPARVLDLGSGQGRHAVLAARLGHRVTGVDESATGIAQMCADAQQAGVVVRGVVADVLKFRTRARFDVVLLVRVLCHLTGDEARAQLLQRLPGMVKPAGFVVIADRAGSRRIVGAHFAANAALWTVEERAADWICARRLG